MVKVEVERGWGLKRRKLGDSGRWLDDGHEGRGV